MTTQPNDYEPTESYIEMVIEDATGKLLKPENAEAGIASMRRRIAELEAQKSKVIDQLDAAANLPAADGLNRNLTLIDRDLKVARERFAHYESQVGRQN